MAMTLTNFLAATLLLVRPVEVLEKVAQLHKLELILRF